jgi:protein-S-isoprenylcysteine O-methyltransferase Ste14
MSYLELIYVVPLVIVMLCWGAVAFAFLFRKRGGATEERKRDPRAMAGLLLEAAGYVIVWMFRRNTAYLFPLPGVTFDIFIGVVVCLLALFSAWLVAAAVRTLGRQWAVAARVLEGHQLVTTGPYARVRNPIYSGLLGMLIATGLAHSVWWSIPAGGSLYWIGTMIRVKSEERLLREQFGGAFDAYTRSVPSMIPILFFSRERNS